MKKSVIVIILTVFLGVSNLKAQYFCEDFEYATGDTINEYGWTAFSGLGINPVLVTGPGLESSCYNVTFGNSAKLLPTGEDSYKFLPIITESGELYVSMLVNFSAAQTGDFFFHLGDSAVNNSNKIARVYAKLLDGKVALGLGKNNEDPTYTAGVYNFNMTYLIILKYEFFPGNDNDLVSLFIADEQHCPTCNPEPAPTLGPLGTGENDLSNIGKIVLTQGADSKGATLLIDAICVDRLFCNGALPIELSSFNASVHQSTVVLNWTTTTETNNSSFNIERKAVDQEGGVWQTVSTIVGHGTTTVPQSYSYTDRGLSSGIYTYRLKQIDYNGNYEYFNLTSEVVIGIPNKIYLSQNYPNPFNPVTTISYTLPTETVVSLSVFDITGREVKQLISNQAVSAGYHSITFDATTLSSGIYFYKLTAGNSTQIKKMTVMK